MFSSVSKANMNVAASLTNLCRLCLEADQANIPIFKENEAGVCELFDKISACLPVKLSEDDRLPKNICSTCHKSVDFVYNFWQISSNTEKQLKNMVENAERISNDYEVQECSIDASPENTLILYETLEEKDASEDKDDEEIPDSSNIEIKEVYFGEYLNQCDTIEDENTVLINEESPKINSSTLASEILLTNVGDDVTTQSNNVEDIQISQIVESSNVSLRENKPLKNEPKDKDNSEYELEDFKNSYNCHLCYKVFQKEDLLNEHLTKMHRCFKCPICQKSFSRAANLRHHMNVHKEFKDVKCEKCGSFFKSVNDVRTHMKRVHADPKTMVQLRCSHCEYVTPYYSRLKKHMLRHSNTYLHYCEECGKGFNHSLDLRTHINNHKGVKPYQCEICGKNFNRESYMKRHRESVHVKPFSYECAYCQKRFSFKYSLKSHIKVHLGIITQYPCDYCDKKLSTKMSLRNHVRLHNDERPFKCGVCDKRYTTNGELKSHSFSHVDEKPFKCEKCPKTFRAAFMLKNHMTIHATCRVQIKCSFCEKMYYRYNSLKKHVQKHHKIEAIDRHMKSESAILPT